MDEKTSHTWALYYFVSLACVMLLGLPMWYTPSGAINPDSYLYIGIANYYLSDPTPHLRDAFTVGPVIPIILWAFKKIALLFFQPGLNLDVGVLKFTAFLCHLVIVNFGGAYLRKFAGAKVVGIFLIFYMMTSELNFEFLSLNGELLCVAWMSIIMAWFANGKPGKHYVVPGIFSALTIYTKIQAFPVLGMLLLTHVGIKKENLRAWIAISVPILLAEILLFENGLGLIRHISGYLSYVNIAPGAMKGSVSRWYLAIVFMYWAFYRTLSMFPAIIFPILLLLLSTSYGKQTSGYQLKFSWVLWLFITLLVMVVPFHLHGHYALLAIIFMLVYTGPVLSNLPEPEFKFSFKTALLTLLVVALVSGRIFYASSGLVNWGITDHFHWGKEADQVAEIVEKSPGTLLVHGWDYRFYSAMNSGIPTGKDISMVRLGFITSDDYLHDVLARHYKYIVDTVGYSGLENQPEREIKPDTQYGRTLYEYYNLVYDSNGLRLFQLKGTDSTHSGLTATSPLAENSYFPVHQGDPSWIVPVNTVAIAR
jgi:hypothetical protein